MQARKTIVKEKEILKTMIAADIPGVAIAFVNHHGSIETQEIGVTKKDSKSKVNSTTIFGAASLSKSVFSYLVLKLVHEGRLDLQKPLNDILPFEQFCDQFCQEYNCRWEKTPADINRAQTLNVKMILSHTTGFDVFKNKIDSRFNPGTEYRYSGLPLMYLQKVIEKLTHLTFEDLANKYVFKPLEMKNSSFYPKYNLDLMSETIREPGTIYLKATKHGLVYEVLTDDSAMPWRNVIPWLQLPSDFPTSVSEIILSKEKWLSTIIFHISKNHDIPPANAANSLFTTAEDYAKFINAWMNDETLKYAFEPIISMTKDEWAVGVNVSSEDLRKLACGLGFELEDTGKNNLPLAYKTGDMNQWRAQVAMDLNNKTAIVYFANGENGHILSKQIITPYVKLNHALNYFSQKYGFAVEPETDWQKNEKARFDHIGKYLELRNNLQKAIKTKHIPGISIATRTEGYVESYSIGIMDVTNPQLVTNQTMFEAASLSKPVFAYIVLKQVAKGLFSRPGESAKSGLDVPLYEICKEFGPPHMRDDPNYKKITLRMLLSHQARLPNEFPSLKDQKYIAPEDTLGFDYSGEAYRFLMEILYKKTGRDLWDLSRETFTTLKMKHTRFLPDPPHFQVEKEERAVGHDVNGKKDETDHFRLMTFPHPAASLITTAEDYLKFLDELIKDKFVIELMTYKPVPLEVTDKKALDLGVPLSALHHLAWGNGIGIQKTTEGTILFHWGDINTNRSFFAVNLATNKVVVCLTNSANGPAIYSEITKTVGDLTPALVWLKIRENQPIQFKESNKSIEQPSIATQSFFSHKQESSTKHISENNSRIWLRRNKGG